jgi:predicted nucleotidyltransferase
MIDLPPSQLAQIQKLIAHHLPGANAFAFGSRVTGTARKHSDLDVAVERAAPLTWQELASLREALMESDLPIRVDVVDWAHCSPRFRELAGRDRHTLAF